MSCGEMDSQELSNTFCCSSCRHAHASEGTNAYGQNTRLEPVHATAGRIALEPKVHRMRRGAGDIKLPPGRPDIVVLRTPRPTLPANATARKMRTRGRGPGHSIPPDAGERAGPPDPPGCRGEGRATRSPRSCLFENLPAVGSLFCQL